MHSKIRDIQWVQKAKIETASNFPLGGLRGQYEYVEKDVIYHQKIRHLYACKKLKLIVNL